MITLPPHFKGIRPILVTVLILCGTASTSLAEANTATDSHPSDAKVFFVEPANGATVTSPVKIVMGVNGMTVKKAGELMKGTGHHHVIVNQGHIAAGTVVPADAKHIHFGGGQTETELTLPVGEHTLTLQFADGFHQSYGKALSSTIHVTVQE